MDWFNLGGMLSQRHVRQVEQPLHLEIVGELPQVPGEVFDRQPGALGVGVNGGWINREDPGTFASAVYTVIVLAQTKSGNSLEVHDGVEPFLLLPAPCYS